MQDDEVHIVSGLQVKRIEKSWLDYWWGHGIFLFTNVSGLALGPTIHRIKESLSPGVKCVGHEADPSSPSSGKAKNVWSHTSTVIKHRDSFNIL
jgi:hypothetical protein